MSVKHFPSFAHSEGRVQIKDSMSQMISISSSVDNDPEHSFKPVLFSSSGVGWSLRTEQIRKHVRKKKSTLKSVKNWGKGGRLNSYKVHQHVFESVMCQDHTWRSWTGSPLSLAHRNEDRCKWAGKRSGSLIPMFCKISHCSSQHRAQWCAQQCLAAASLIKVKPLVYLLQEQCHCFLASEKWDVHVVTI